MIKLIFYVLLLFLFVGSCFSDNELNISDEFYRRLSGVWRTPNMFLIPESSTHSFSWGQESVAMAELIIDLHTPIPFMQGSEILQIEQISDFQYRLYLGYRVSTNGSHRYSTNPINDTQIIVINDDGSINIPDNLYWGNGASEGPYFKRYGPNAHDIEYVINQIENQADRRRRIEYYNNRIREPGEPRIEFREDSSQ